MKSQSWPTVLGVLLEACGFFLEIVAVKLYRWSDTVEGREPS